MAGIVEPNQMNVVLPQANKEVAVEVLEFLEELNVKEQREFMNFLQGARFAMTLRGIASEKI